jgi:REP element-mobilizing transposase RayT
VHVTLRVREDVPSLRAKRLVRAVRRSLAKGCERGDFRVVHYSLMGNHAHLLVEADSRVALASGMKSVGARLARAVNRVFGRSGPVLDGRYHAVVLRSPLQVRRALGYVLLNARRHAKRASQVLRIDPASSGRWFRGWNEAWALEADDPLGGRREGAEPRSWLLRVGWLRHGRIGLGEIPG